jgi:hypothetical protein
MRKISVDFDTNQEEFLSIKNAAEAAEMTIKEYVITCFKIGHANVVDMIRSIPTEDSNV